MNLNLSKFKKTKEDERSTELLHPDGHTIRIAHNGLKPMMRKELKAIPLAEGGDVPGAEAPDSGQGIADLFNPAVSAAPMSMPEAQPAPVVEQQPQMSMPQVAELAVPRDVASAQPQENPLVAAEKTSVANMVEANNSGIAGETAKAKALGNTGAQQAKEYEAANKVLATAQTAYQGTVKKLSEEGDKIWQEMQDPKSNIDPDHFWTNHSKVSAAIGMILGGLGSGLTGGENPAAKYIQHQMDMDLEAQKANIGKKKSLLDYNLSRFGNERDALAATRVMQNDILANQLNKVAGTNASDLAKANAQIASVHYKQENAKLIHQIAVNQALMTLNKGGTDSIEGTLQYLRVNNPDKAKEIEARYVPGVGLGSVTIPEKVREQIVGRHELDRKIADLREFAKKHEGTVIDRSVVTTGQAMAQEAKDAYRRANGEGVPRAGEMAVIDSLIDADPTKFEARLRTLPKYNVVQKSNRISLNGLLKTYGLPEQSAAPEYKTVNGVKYMRGANGEAIKVK